MRSENYLVFFKLLRFTWFKALGHFVKEDDEALTQANYSLISEATRISDRSIREYSEALLKSNVEGQIPKKILGKIERSRIREELAKYILTIPGTQQDSIKDHYYWSTFKELVSKPDLDVVHAKISELENERLANLLKLEEISSLNATILDSKNHNEEMCEHLKEEVKTLTSQNIALADINKKSVKDISNLEEKVKELTSIKSNLLEYNGHLKEKIKRKNRVIFSTSIAIFSLFVIGILLYPKVSDNTQPETLISINPDDTVSWNNAKEEFVWFNAQYATANTIHQNAHLSLLEKGVKFKLIIVQPHDGNISNFDNFKVKFHAMRNFLRTQDALIDKTDVTLENLFKDIYIIKEDRIPSFSFFMTRDRDSERERVIMYLEDEEFLNNRKPTISIESYNNRLIELLKSRYQNIENIAKEGNGSRGKRLSFKALISNQQDSIFYIK